MSSGVKKTFKDAKETHEFNWVISNHSSVVSSSSNLALATRSFDFTSKSGVIYNVSVGYGMVDKKHFSPTLKLDKTETTQNSAVLKWSLYLSDPTSKSNKFVSEVKIYENNFPKRGIHCPWVLPMNDALSSNSQNEVRWVVRITLSSAAKPFPDFGAIFTTEQKKGMKLLLSDSSSSDLKIICSDAIELDAHKLILSAQNPVFATMIASDILEDSKLKIEDVSAKTMQILLRFLYTGNLDNDWRNHDRIVEFFYASGKFKLTYILEMLDNTLGKFDHKDKNLQLLGLATKYSLKNAEYRLIPRVKESIINARNCDELFKRLEH